MSSIRNFALNPETDFSIDSEVMHFHERHQAGVGNLKYYIDNYYRKPKDFPSYVYTSIVMQAYSVVTGIEAHRRNRPYCMGTLYWQINDVWPVISWASIDYYGQWKALHYRARDAYADVAVFVEHFSTNDFKLNFVNEKLNDAKVTVKIEIILFNGTFLGNFTWP